MCRCRQLSPPAASSVSLMLWISQVLLLFQGCSFQKEMPPHPHPTPLCFMYILHYIQSKFEVYLCCCSCCITYCHVALQSSSVGGFREGVWRNLRCIFKPCDPPRCHCCSPSSAVWCKFKSAFAPAQWNWNWWEMRTFKFSSVAPPTSDEIHSWFYASLPLM